jgi:hypothetical protein
MFNFLGSIQPGSIDGSLVTSNSGAKMSTVKERGTQIFGYCPRILGNVAHLHYV